MNLLPRHLSKKSLGKKGDKDSVERVMKGKEKGLQNSAAERREPMVGAQIKEDAADDIQEARRFLLGVVLASILGLMIWALVFLLLKIILL